MHRRRALLILTLLTVTAAASLWLSLALGSEIADIKHAYRAGVKAQAGVDL